MPARAGAGRKLGGKNKATIERALVAERIMAEAEMAGRKLGKEVLEECMNALQAIAMHCAPPQGASEKQMDAWLAGKKKPEFEKFIDLTLTAAKELAKYQSPTFRAVALAPAPVNQDQGKKVTKFTLHIFGEDPRMKVIEGESKVIDG